MIGGSMVKDIDIVNLVGRSYDAVLDPRRWTDVLRELAATFHAAAGGIHVRTFRRGTRATTGDAGCSWFASSGLDPAYEKAYGEHYFAEDPWAACVPDRLEPGVFSRGDELVPRRALARTGFTMTGTRFLYAAGFGGHGICVAPRIGERVRDLALAGSLAG
jgi:hypothetical protein